MQTSTFPRDRLIDGIDQTPVLLLGETKGRRDYVFIYEGSDAEICRETAIQVSCSRRPEKIPIFAPVFDLYKNPREDRPQDSIQYAVAFGANFGMMIQRHSCDEKTVPGSPASS